MSSLQLAFVDRTGPIELLPQWADRSHLALRKVRPRMDDDVAGVVMRRGQEAETPGRCRQDVGRTAGLSKVRCRSNAATSDYKLLDQLPSRDGKCIKKQQRAVELERAQASAIRGNISGIRQKDGYIAGLCP